MSFKILIVDDEPDVLLLCRVNLEFEGYSVIDAHNGEEALEILKREQVHLVLLDVMMPGMDGWDVLAAIKGDSSTSNLPVIMLTAKAQDRDQIRGWTSGVSDYVIKPFNPIALSQTIRRALEPATPQEAERRRSQILDKLRIAEIH